LTDILNGDAGGERILAAEALAGFPAHCDPAAATLVEMVRNDSSGLRRQAIVALGRLGPKARSAAATLAEALDAPDATVRLEAALALAQTGADAQAGLPVLLEAVRERNHPSRGRAMEALASPGLRTETAVSALIRVLWEDGPNRAKAAQILGRMGPRAKSAVPTLSNLVKRPDPEVRIQAALALWKVDNRTEAAVSVLVRELKTRGTRGSAGSLLLIARPATVSNPPAVPPCQQAAEALGQMGSAARTAAPSLRQALADPDEAVRSAAAQALQKIGA
jgi:HEAT repeat protein